MKAYIKLFYMSFINTLITYYFKLKKIFKDISIYIVNRKHWNLDVHFFVNLWIFISNRRNKKFTTIILVLNSFIKAVWGEKSHLWVLVWERISINCNQE